ncbi:MAG: hypothetical protein U5K79_02925 [Cyclobacteriaceae bacterium]|nr:hypothetical protein [Cyclobacteriaceae bacterium]
MRNSNAGELAKLNTITFSPNADEYLDLVEVEAGTSAPGNMVFMGDNFRFPQVWRSNLAVDKKFGNGFTVSLEALLTQDRNAIRMYNANFKPETDGIVVEGNLERPRYTSATARNENSSITTAIVLDNVQKGYSTALTAQVSKQFDRGFYGSLAYTYTDAKEVTANPGSQASSVSECKP